MPYHVIVTYDGHTVMDTVGDLEEWLGFGQGLQGNIAVALNATGQEHPQRALLQQALDGLPDSDAKASLTRSLEALLPRQGEPAMLCFSYDDPGPKKPDGTPVRANIERVIEPGQAIPILVSHENPNMVNAQPHEYVVYVEEVG